MTRKQDMGQLKLHGKDRVEFIEKLVVGDIAGLAPHHSRLSVFTNPKGGIQDDTVITNAGDYLYLFFFFYLFKFNFFF